MTDDHRSDEAMTEGLDPILASRLAAVAGPPDDADWLDVRRRAHILRPASPRRRRGFASLPRPHSRRVALAAALAATAIAAVPPVGLAERVASLGTSVADVIGGEPEENFRAHDGRDLPLYFAIEKAAGSDGLELSGIVWSERIASLELRYADGKSEPITVGQDGAFRHVPSTDRRPEQVIARGTDGRVVETYPVVEPPPPGSNAGHGRSDDPHR